VEAHAGRIAQRIGERGGDRVAHPIFSKR